MAPKRTERPGSSSPAAKKQATKQVSDKSKLEEENSPVAKSLEIKRDYGKLFEQVQDDPKKRVELFQKVKGEENLYRELFAQQRDSTELNDPHALLIDPHEHVNIFKYVDESSDELAIPRIKSADVHDTLSKDRVIVDKKEFLRNFELFSENQLRDLNWDNILIAGGSVLACLLPTGDATTAREKREFYHKDAYKNSDIDIFIYGLNAKDANEKMKHVYECISQSMPGAEAVCAFRSQHAITIVSQFPYRHVQIVLRLYKSPAEVLMGFDVDACAIGFDGTNVWMSPRAHHAIIYRANTVDMTRRSPSYEMRLAKYASRGFSILVPSLDESKIDPQIFEKRFDQVQGLAKLILLIKLETPTARYTYKEQQRLRKLRPEAKNAGTFFSMLSSDLDDEDEDYNEERLAGASASDYSTVFLPWGPKWNATKIRKLMYTKDMILNSKWYDPKKKYHTHPCFFGTVDQVIHDCCGSCPPIPPEDQDPDTPFVSGEVSWLEVNPGQQNQLQRIGSFHPITEGDWTEGAFISDDVEDLCCAVNVNNVDLAKKLLTSPNVDANKRDSSGRTPLHVASLTNAVACAKLLLEKGARVSSTMTDGRTALHIASQYGHHEIVSLLIARGAELEEEAERKKKEKEDKMEEDGEEDGEEKEDEDEDGEGDGDGEEGDEFCIRNVVDQQKKDKLAAMNEFDRQVDDEGDDKLDIESKDWDYQMTALQFACFFGHTECVKKLTTDGGADVQVLTDNKTFTTGMLCVSGSHADTLKVLLDAGYPVDHLNNQKATALHLAACYLDTACFDVLVAANASLTTEDNQKMVAVEYAMSSPFVVTPFDAHDNDNSNNNNNNRRHRGKFGFGGHQQQQQTQAPAPQTVRTVDDIIHIVKVYVNKKLNMVIYQTLVPKAIAKWSVPLLQLLIKNHCNVDGIDGNSTALDLVEDKIKQIEDKLKSDLPSQLKDPVHLTLTNSLHNFASYQGAPVKEWNDIIKKAKTSYKKQPKHESLLRFLTRILVNVLEVDLTNLVEDKRKEIHLTDEQKELYTQKRTLLGKMFDELHKVKARRYNDIPGHHYHDRNRSSTNYHRYDALKYPLELQYQSVANVAFDKKLEPVHTKAFEAVLDDDVNALNKVTLDLEVGQQAHAASSVHLGTVQLSTLNFATYLNHPNTAKRLLEISAKQFTPLVRQKKSGQFVPTINNHDLTRMVKMGIKPGEYVSATGHSTEYELEDEDPNAKAIQVNSTVSPSELALAKFSHLNKNYNCLHVAATYNSAETARAILSFLVDNKIPLHQKVVDENEVVDTSTEALLTKLLGNNNRTESPFLTAVAQGNIETAEVLLQYGGVRVVTEEDLPEVYAGLDVGGQKMDWALEHQANDESDKDPYFAIHSAAAYNQPEMIHYLVSKAPDVWRAYFKKAFPARDLPDLPPHFDLTATLPKHGETALHIAMFSNDRLEAAQRIIDLDTDKLVINAQTKCGYTALMIATKLNHLDQVKVLLKAGASISYRCKSGFTAIHIAAQHDHVEILNELLAHADKKDLTQTTHHDNYTPLFIAVLNTAGKSVEALLANPHCDRFAKDVLGFYPLHHAICKEDMTIIKLLAPKYFKDYRVENGVHHNVLDTALLSLLKNFADRNNYFNLRSPSFISQDILQYIASIVKTERQLAQHKYVSSTTDVLIQQTLDKIEQTKQAKKKNRYYRNRDNKAAFGTEKSSLSATDIIRGNNSRYDSERKLHLALPPVSKLQEFADLSVVSVA